MASRLANHFPMMAGPNAVAEADAQAAIPQRGRIFLMCLMASGLVSCASTTDPASISTAPREIVISVEDQKLALMEEGRPVAVYPVSTSKFCLGDTPNSYGTPLGRLKVAQKIGSHAPMGAVFKNRQPTGEILPPNAPGRDPIVTRILRLTGQEHGNARTFARNIYIHGTPEESTIGRPASFGCVRMTSQDVVDLYNRIPSGTQVHITKNRLPSSTRLWARRQSRPAPPAAGKTPAPPIVASIPKPMEQAQGPVIAHSHFGPPAP
jgi:lipoprotein-anchoring transpeptidase ErfK/SrfK